MQSAFLESKHPAQPTSTHTSLAKQIRLLLLTTVSLQNENEKLNCTKSLAFMVLGTSEKFLGQTSKFEVSEVKPESYKCSQVLQTSRLVFYWA